MEPHKGLQMFQIEINNRYQTPGVGVVLKQAPEKCINKLLPESNHADSIDINPRKVMLLNSQSTMDLLLNEDIV